MFGRSAILSSLSKVNKQSSLTTKLQLRQSVSTVQSHSLTTYQTNCIIGSRLRDVGHKLSFTNVIKVFSKSSNLNIQYNHGAQPRLFSTFNCRNSSKNIYNSGGAKQLKHDTLVYSHKNDKFYQTLSYFGIFQLGIWAYLSLFAFQQLKTVPIAVQDPSSLPWYKRFLYRQGQYKNSLSVLSLIVGGVVFFITATYPRRVIKSLWVLKGGQNVKVTTYSWMGKNRTFTKPVEHLSCMEARAGPAHNIPMKIKDNNFYYIIDKQGTFPKTDLFDYVIGVKRKL